MSDFQHPDSPAHGVGPEKDGSGGVVNDFDSKPDSNDSDGTGEKVQAGVQQVEAIATVWSKPALVGTYLLIWIIYFIVLLQQGVATNLSPYVTSAFAAHSLTATVSVLSSVIGGACNLTVAKILDVFGRPQGYAISLVITTVGLVMMAKTDNVELYAAAQVFWTVGNSALLYTVNIFIADTSGLRNRGLMTALTSSPNIITLWISGPIATGFLNGPGWAWGFGAFAIMVPILCLPFLAILLFYSVKAKREGVIKKASSGRNPLQSLLYYGREFDAVGLLLLTAGLSLFLLSFNLYSYQPQQWRSPMIICFIVFGFLLMVVFALYEKFLAPVKFIPFELLLDRNMVGSCLLGMTLFISYYCWYSFFTSFLQVVNNLSVTKASYVADVYGLGGSIFAIACGYIIRFTGRYKAMALYGAVPIYTLFMGLMIYFRRPDQGIGYIVMCQIFISFASGVVIITPPIAAMAAATHQNFAVVIAIVSMFSSIGGAIGLTVASAIWQSIFPAKLMLYLPVEEQANLLNIYASIEVQLGYPVGSPARIAIQHAYGDAQKMMLVAGTAIWALGFIACAIWRDTNVKNIVQVKGNVV